MRTLVRSASNELIFVIPMSSSTKQIEIRFGVYVNYGSFHAFHLSCPCYIRWQTFNGRPIRCFHLLYPQERDLLKRLLYLFTSVLVLVVANLFLMKYQCLFKTTWLVYFYKTNTRDALKNRWKIYVRPKVMNLFRMVISV